MSYYKQFLRQGRCSIYHIKTIYMVTTLESKNGFLTMDGEIDEDELDSDVDDDDFDTDEEEDE